MYEIVGIEYEFTCIITLKTWAASYCIAKQSEIANNGIIIGKLADLKYSDCSCRYYNNANFGQKNG